MNRPEDMTIAELKATIYEGLVWPSWKYIDALIYAARAEGQSEWLAEADMFEAELADLRAQLALERQAHEDSAKLQREAFAAQLGAVQALTDGDIEDLQEIQRFIRRERPLRDVLVFLRSLRPLAPAVEPKHICSCGTTMVCPDMGCDKHKLPEPSAVP